MGGLTVMNYLLCYLSEKIFSCVIVDISPKNYTLNYDKEIEVLSLPIKNYKTRKDIDKLASKIIPEDELRNFLLMNISRTKIGTYYWKLNVSILKEFISTNIKNFRHTKNKCNIPILFIRGLKSDFMEDSDKEIIEKYFTCSKILNIPNAGHWLHHTHFQVFTKIIQEWVNNSVQIDKKIIK